ERRPAIEKAEAIEAMAEYLAARVDHSSRGQWCGLAFAVGFAQAIISLRRLRLRASLRAFRKTWSRVRDPRTGYGGIASLGRFSGQILALTFGDVSRSLRRQASWWYGRYRPRSPRSVGLV